MKKRLCWMLLVMILVACNQDDVEKNHENTIKDLKLDAREGNLLKAVAGDTLFTYDVSVNELGGKLEVWLEKYEYGQLDERVGGIETDVFEDGQILVALQKIPDTSNAILKLVIVDESGYLSGENVLELPGNWAYGHGSFLGEAASLTGDMAIGQIIYTEKGSLGIKVSWGELVNNPIALANELKEYPVVYLVRCSFEVKGTE